MRLSHYFLKPRKDAPSDATLISHKLMIKSSMIKQTTSGIYAWLPLGLKVLKKIEDIIRKFHNLYGCQELLMPTIQSSSIWKKSERYNDYGPEMLKFRDRNKKELLYGPTNEELITEIFKEYINSYKDLPKNLYQIQWKFRDEIRPRYGVMRCREFLMKDNYSFDISKNDAEKSYDNMFKCYLEIFNEIGINVIPVKADSGAMGGDLSHEFHLISKSGDTDIYYDKKIGDINGLNARNSFKLLRNLYSVTKDEYKKKQDLDASKLIKTKGIEIGHIFYFGTKYSDKLDAYVLNEKGEVFETGGDPKIVIGSLYNNGKSLMNDFKHRFNTKELNIEISNDIKSVIWRKLMYICALSGIMCLFRQPLANILSDNKGRKILLEIITETYNVAIADNAVISKEEINNVFYELDTNRENSISSMYEDLKKSNSIEVDALNTYVSNKANIFHIDTPMNDLISSVLEVYMIYR